MRLKLSDKVLLNFFILPIFSFGCGSMRSHIWAARGPGNFAKLVQRAAQTTARARGTARGRRRLVLLLRLLAGRGRQAALGRRQGSGLGGGWARGGVLGGAGGDRHPRCPGGPAPGRRSPHSPSFVRQSGEAAAAGEGRRRGRWTRRGRQRETRAGQVPSPRRGADPRAGAPLAPGLARGTPARPRCHSDSEASAALLPPSRTRRAPSRPPALRPPPPRSSRALHHPGPRTTDGQTDGRAR